MSEGIELVRELVRAGFAGIAHRDERGEIVALQAVRLRAGHIETVLIYGEHEALAARCRDESRPAVVWHRAGSTAEVITALLELPAPGTRGAPTLAGKTPPGLWLPR
jgi:hypothetical protein